MDKQKEHAQKENKQPRKVNITISQEDLERLKLMRDEVDFIADSKAALLAQTTPFTKSLLYLIGAFIIIGFIWASLAKLEEVTRGMGRVVPSSQVQLIQNLEGGILTKIFVKEGNMVKKGEVLAQLDRTRFGSQYQESFAKYAAYLAAIARLKAEINGENKIKFPRQVARDKSLVEHETRLFNTRRDALRNALSNLTKSYQFAKKELNITEPLVNKGVMSKIELLRLQREVNSIKSNMDAVKDKYYQEAASQYTQYQAQANIVEKTLAELKDRMHRTTIISPVNGVVKQIYVNTIGGIIEPAKPLMEIVPVEDKLVIEAQIKPSDIAFVKVGQKATVRITAYDYAIYGSLSAKVIHISADTSTDRMGNSFYQVNLETDKNYLGSKKNNFPIKPGMTAMVDIITGEKSMLSYILKPILRAREKAMRER